MTKKEKAERLERQRRQYVLSESALNNEEVSVLVLHWRKIDTGGNGDTDKKDYPTA